MKVISQEIKSKLNIHVSLSTTSLGVAANTAEGYSRAAGDCGDCTVVLWQNVCAEYLMIILEAEMPAKFAVVLS